MICGFIYNRAVSVLNAVPLIIRLNSRSLELEVVVVAVVAVAVSSIPSL